MNELISPDAGSIVPAGAHEDPFALVFGPAQPTLNAARKLQPLFDYYKGREYLNVKQADQHKAVAFNRCEAIPEDAVMYAAEKLFHAAECEPAPEPWLHAAIGLMLDSMPNAKNISPSYRFGLVDAMQHDPEVHERFGPGFSYAVIAQVVREIRRTAEFVPTHAAFLKLCSQHRSLFGKRQYSVECLINLRQNAEDVLIKTGDLKVPDDDWE
jgi:hypothetical protein